MITKRNNTAMAPTYITINEIGKNSKLNISSTQVTVLNVKIRKRTLNIGFFELITKIEDIMHKLEKKTNNIELIIRGFYFFLTPYRLLLDLRLATPKKSYLPRTPA